MDSKLILTDVDGVLLDWTSSFEQWIQQHGYTLVNPTEYDLELRYNIPKEQCLPLVKTFNESAAIGFLSPFKDAVYYVRRLHEEYGYKFLCITSLGLDIHAAKLRKQNLFDIFGHQPFEDIICLDTGADKTHALEPFRNSELFWIEDKFENALVGQKLGLRSILVKHDHNNFDKWPYYRAETWKEIFGLITGTGPEF